MWFSPGGDRCPAVQLHPHLAHFLHQPFALLYLEVGLLSSLTAVCLRRIGALPYKRRSQTLDTIQLKRQNSRSVITAESHYEYLDFFLYPGQPILLPYRPRLWKKTVGTHRSCFNERREACKSSLASQD